ncbi:protein phosphatase 4 regulatory subunit 3 [Geosmithia morbida]|uniref:Protein phosphatase 4 regulatory subunit 3 n=1 Tax=Geosmithia morbida TaxID=1094350 RepID=A0A9P5D895_9HYPO|nr:protein phosphatase 4 regulatory subunit 3 [Geosmithia morbida]KAF4126560.1 protein phosphatase 4 regulatory subunit 3 [Geosmithia morbida]
MIVQIPDVLPYSYYPVRDAHTLHAPSVLRPTATVGRAYSDGTVAALTVLSQNETTTSELSLQQHLDIAPDLVAYNSIPAEGQSEPLMMAQSVPHQATDKKRVKVYELRNHDWFDRGTGFCMAIFTETPEGRKEPKVIVESEDQPDRLLLETKIHKEDGFQKQQDTLIVWQEPGTHIDMALSFQEAEGCSLIWHFVSNVQQAFQNSLGGADDSLSEDITIEGPLTITLPAAELGNLPEIESSMRIMSSTANGRDALSKSIMADDYISKLIPLVEMAEDLESLHDLHRLCNIMKTILLLNDTSIIEHAVSDDCVLGVVGALEYDPDFPSHKANHRHWLDNKGRYKEVVPIEDAQTRHKIHQTYRLQYLKDVVLARILDDPTFSVLNSLIFFNQVDIVQHLQGNASFLAELFGIFNSTSDPATTPPSDKKKTEAVLFIQQCCSIAKNIQPPARQSLYNNFLVHGLLLVINFGLKSGDVRARVGATDILISVIDHDPQMIRHTIYRQMNEDQPPLTDSLIDLLLAEVDLGVKAQISEAIKVLLDHGIPLHQQQQMAEKFAAQGGGPNGAAEFARQRAQATDPQHELFLTRFYESSALRLFKPLIDLEKRTDLTFPAQQASMFSHLIEILCFFIRQHHQYSRFFVLNNNIVPRVCQLLGSPDKFLQLVAIRFVRTLISMQEEFFIRHLAEKRVLGPILEVLSRSISRDNLLSSASLELFEYIKKENIKDLIKYLVENHREQMIQVSYMSTFCDMVTRYDETGGYTSNVDYFLETDEDMGSTNSASVSSSARKHQPAPNVRMMEHISIDPAEEEYWNTSDPEDDDDDKNSNSNGNGNGNNNHNNHTQQPASSDSNGASTPSSNYSKLVDYPSDEDNEEEGEEGEEEEEEEVVEEEEQAQGEDDNLENIDPATATATAAASTPSPASASAPPKRRREEDDEEEDEMDRLSHSKRRNSTTAATAPSDLPSTAAVRRRKSFSPSTSSSSSSSGSKSSTRKMTISLSSTALKSGGGGDDRS